MANIRKHVTKDGKTKFYVQIRLKGQSSQTGCFDRLTDAKNWIQEIESAIRNNRYFKTAESKKHTFIQLADRYITTIAPQKKTAKDQIAQLNWWKSKMGEKLLADITPSLISDLKDALLSEKTNRGKNRTSATTNRYLAVLSHTFTIACKEWGWLRDNPVSLITKPKEPRGRVRFLSDEERQRLLNACEESKNPYLLTIVVLALSTGMRLGEIINLTWANIDLERSWIILEDTKNGERRQVPIKGKAFSLLKKLSDNRLVCSEFVFPDTISYRKPIDIRSAWNYAINRSEIKDFRFHDLRHSCASYLAMNGASMAEIAAVLGHKTLQMTKRYTHLSNSHISDVVAKMNEKILG